MADENILTEGDEDFVIVETPADDTQPGSEGEDSVAGGQQDTDDDHDDDDERLGANEDDAEGDPSDKNKARRKKRREMQRRAREAKDQELAELRAFRTDALPRLAALEQNAIGLNQATLESRIAQARAVASQAEAVRKAAEEAGNVSDVLEAIKLRDQAYAEVEQLTPALEKVQSARRPATQGAPQAASTGEEFASAWQKHNPWYNDGGMDDASVVTRTVAAQLVKEGYKGDTLAYWQQLTQRVAEVVDTEALGGAAKPAKVEKPGRKAPPTGMQREHSTTGVKQREVYLSPQRIQAIKDAGMWDDPVARNRMVKSYLEHDRNNPAGR